MTAVRYMYKKLYYPEKQGHKKQQDLPRHKVKHTCCKYMVGNLRRFGEKHHLMNNGTDNEECCTKIMKPRKMWNTFLKISVTLEALIWLYALWRWVLGLWGHMLCQFLGKAVGRNTVYIESKYIVYMYEILKE